MYAPSNTVESVHARCYADDARAGSSKTLYIVKLLLAAACGVGDLSHAAATVHARASWHTANASTDSALGPRQCALCTWVDRCFFKL